jgi:hypothetical protein
MPRRTASLAIALVALGAPVAPAQQDGAGQAEEVAPDSLQKIDDIGVTNADGERIGEVDEVLIDGEGRIVAVTVEVGGVLDLGDEDLVLGLDDLAWREGGYRIDLTPDEVDGLPRFD